MEKSGTLSSAHFRTWPEFGAFLINSVRITLNRHGTGFVISQYKLGLFKLGIQVPCRSSKLRLEYGISVAYWLRKEQSKGTATFT